MHSAHSFTVASSGAFRRPGFATTAQSASGVRLALAACLLACAAMAFGNEHPAGNRSETVIAGDYFGAGGALEPGAAVEGDAFVAGGEVTVRVPVGGDAVLSGGSISVAGRPVRRRRQHHP